MNGNATPSCSICCETLGKYGGPVTIQCGHNFCLQCISSVQHRKAECPLCRAPFAARQPLVVNHELRDLVTLAAALHTVEQNDGWQAVTSSKGNSVDEAHREGGHCSRCSAPFRVCRRARHHCRLCGSIFCHDCCAQRLLLPPKFQERQPQRACLECAALLKPLQPFLAGTISKAVRPAVHDLTDASVMRSWINNPLSASLETDIYQATNIVRGFAQVGALQPEKSVPSAVLQGAAGLAILSVGKIGMGWSATVGTGLVLARRSDGTWSAPSAISLCGLGWGLQLGGALMDLLIVLRNRSALQAFCGSPHLGMGGNISLAVGPLGRQAEANMRLGTGGAAVCYSYSCSRGAFAGVSVESTLITTRHATNQDFYGRPLTPKQLLLEESVAPPVAADALYGALEELMAKVDAEGAANRLIRGAYQDSGAGSRRMDTAAMAQQAREPVTSYPVAAGAAAPAGHRDGGGAHGGDGFASPRQEDFAVASAHVVYDSDDSEAEGGLGALFAEG
ncbi:hypothetical protein WJX72_001461 [[Myrmecia] bisecta]|uniref:Uncharacterized protein n=1 Tax=[Myrmecia] bisecta TaxID=41462 RepID=A0AAW1PAS5_9CHLO